MDVIKIRRDNDFKLLLSFSDCRGVPLDAVGQEFRFLYKDIFGNGYEVSYDGTVRKNCYVEGEKLYAVFENHGLQEGLIRREEHYRMPDEHFADREWNFGENGFTNIYLYE